MLQYIKMFIAMKREGEVKDKVKFGNLSGQLEQIMRNKSRKYTQTFVESLITKAESAGEHVPK